MIYMGSPDFAVLPLEKLVQAGHEIVAIFTQPDKPRNRGKQMQPTPVKAKGLELGLPVYAPAKINTPEQVELIRSLQPELIVVVAYGKILKEEIFSLPPYGTVNIHASLLPKYRGAAPIHWAVINGEKESGVTIMYIEKGLDSGDMLLWEACPIGPEEDTGSLHDRLSQMGADLMIKAVDQLAAGTVKPVPQDHTASTYAPLLTKELERIDWHMPAEKLHDLIRGLSPWPGAYTLYKGKRLKIYESRVVAEKGEPGQLLHVEKDGFVVACGEGALHILSLQPEGKSRMTGEAFVRGYPIAQGEFLE